MRLTRAMVVVVSALAVTVAAVVWLLSTHAVDAEFTSTQGDPVSAERIIADMVIAVTPISGQSGTGWCLELESGILTVNPQAVGGDPAIPVSFFLAGCRGSDPAATMHTQVTAAEARLSTPLSGALYCLSLQDQASVPSDASLATLTNFTRMVALRMVLAPSSS